MQGYALIPLIAFFLNIFLLAIFLSANKNSLIKRFMTLLVFMVIWSGSSFLMRTEFLGMINPWYHASLAGIWLGVLSTNWLVCGFAGKKLTLPEIGLGIFAVAMLVVNIFSGWFLAPPEAIPTPDGDVTFVYRNFTFGTYIMYFFLALCFVAIISRVVTCIRRRTLTRSQVVPLSIGAFAMVSGNFIIILPPFAGIPIDIVAGSVFAICNFIALYYKHLFSLSLAFSRRTYSVIAAISLILFIMCVSGSLEHAVAAMPEPFGSNSVAVVSLIAVVWTVATYAIIWKMSEKLFLRDHNTRTNGLQAYHETVSRSLEVASVADCFCNQVMKSIKGVKAVRMCTVASNGDLVITGSYSALEIGQVAISGSSAVMDWLGSHTELLSVDDFSRTMEYRAMWEVEKTQLELLKIHYIMPLVDGDEMLGAALLTLSSRDQHLSMGDVEYLMSLSMLTGSSVRNSLLYEQVALDAQTDDLTGLLNRKHFLAQTERLHLADPRAVMSLMILNLDDFKLYNQLYGEKTGDDALRRIANIISTSVGPDNLVARYGGKEFAVLLPGRDTRTAYRLAENLSKQVYDLNRTPDEELGSLKILTMSIGICSIPFGASNPKQLVDNADMAVYQVKQHGKNGIKVFAVGEVAEGQTPDKIDHEETYSSYANTIYALAAAIDAKDHYTFTHSNNVAYYASELAKAYGLDSDTVEMIREAGLLHDIGKIGIPENVLNKTDRLSSDEYEIMKKHPENAVSIIRHLPSLDYVIPAVVGHHERWDGGGYPRQLSGEGIPLSARILCVADCFDAITTKRCYQEARPLNVALEIMNEGAGSQFDPELVQLFVNEIKEGRIQLQDAQQRQ